MSTLLLKVRKHAVSHPTNLMTPGHIMKEPQSFEKTKKNKCWKVYKGQFGYFRQLDRPTRNVFPCLIKILPPVYRRICVYNLKNA